MPAPAFSTFEGPPQTAFTTLMAYDVSNNLEYLGFAQSHHRSRPFPVTSIVVLTNVGTVNWTAHGLQVGQRVVVSGATVDTDLNGTYVIQSIVNADSFTITTASVGNATYNEATLRVSTTAPRTNEPVWAIKKLYYSGSNNIRISWCEGAASESFAWDSRATYAYF